MKDRTTRCTAVTYLDHYVADNIGPRANKCYWAVETSSCFIACLIIAMKNCDGMKVESEFVSDVLCEMEVLRGLGWTLNTKSAEVHAKLAMMNCSLAVQ